MMRQPLRWRALLQRLQAARQKQAQDVPGAETTATAQRILALLADALAHAPPAEPPDPPAKPAAGAERLAAAEAYARAYPSEAALIRSLGRLPKKFNGGSLSAQMVHDIINSASPVLQALAKRPEHRLAAAAA